MNEFLETVYNNILREENQTFLTDRAQLDILHKSKEVYAITGLHGSRKALDRLHKQIVPIVEQQPQDWLFLIEGAPHASAPEIAYATIIGCSFDIPVVDPIVSVYHKETIDTALASGMSELDVYATLLMGSLSYQDKSNGLEKNIENVTAHWAEKWEREQDYLKGILVYHSYTIQKTGEKQRQQELGACFDQLAVFSNTLSRHHMQKILPNYQDKSKLLMLMGEGHKTLVDCIL